MLRLPTTMDLGIAVSFELPTEPALWLGPALAVQVPPTGTGQDQLLVAYIWDDAPLGKRLPHRRLRFPGR
jgi:hypothetical protein